jgi:RimJ/RimL family protein N-acetyltransferase
MTATFVVRPADPGDAAALKRLGDEVAAEPEGWLATQEGWRSVGDERRYLRAIRRYPHAAVFVAEAEDGSIIGRLSIARDQHPASRHVADLGLMVAHSHRRQGIGGALLAAAVDWAREHDISKLELHVFPYNEPAIRLYEKLGYKREGLRVNHYARADGGYSDVVLMAKQL